MACLTIELLAGVRKPLLLQVFVSHCGLNGIMESVVALVPLVCVPLSGETVANSIRVGDLG